MKIFDTIEQGSDAWHQLRAGLVTGTGFKKVLTSGRAGAASAVRQTYLAELVTQRLTGKPSDGFAANSDMLNGIEREPDARRLFEYQTGKIVQEVSFVQHDWIRAGCSPDGLIGDDEGLEIKAPKAHTHLGYLGLQDRPPAEYEAQVYGSLWITGRQRWYFASYHPDFPPELQLHVVCVERDEAYIAKLAAAVEAFLVEVKVDVDIMEARISAIRAANPERWLQKETTP